MLFSFAMVETDRIAASPTIQAFLKRVERFDEEHPEESKALWGEVMLWGAAVGSRGETLGEIIATQIEYSVEQIRKRGVQISAEEYIDNLFSPNPAGEISTEIIMGRLQLG